MREDDNKLRQLLGIWELLEISVCVTANRWYKKQCRQYDIKFNSMTKSQKLGSTT